MDTPCPTKDVFFRAYSMNPLLVERFALWHVD